MRIRVTLEYNDDDYTDLEAVAVDWSMDTGIMIETLAREWEESDLFIVVVDEVKES